MQNEASLLSEHKGLLGGKWHDAGPSRRMGPSLARCIGQDRLMLAVAW
jgi:hypothetical protein